MKKKLNKNQSISKRQNFKKKYYQRHKRREQGREHTPSSSSFNGNDTTHYSQDPTTYLRDYTTLSNLAFKEIFVKTMTIQENTPLYELFNNNNEQTLTFLRRCTQLINQLNYTKLQLEQWNYYYYLGTMENIWTGRISKKQAQVNSMPYTYGRSKTLIEQRQKKYQQQLNTIQQELTQYLTQKPQDISMEINELLKIVDNFIEQQQSKLRTEFERRRILLKFDAQEHQLVHAFYDLNPRKSEMHLATMLWKLTTEQQSVVNESCLFQQWLLLKSLVPSCTFEDLGLNKINHIIIQHIFNPIKSIFNNLSSNSCNTTDLIQETFSTMQKIFEDYNDKINQVKIKLQTTKENIKKPKINIDQVIQAIEQRQMNIQQRIQYQAAYKIKLLFGTMVIQSNNS